MAHANRGIEEGADQAGRARVITQLYFAVVIRGSVRRLSGNIDYSLDEEERAPTLDNCGNSSLVMDRLFD